MSTTLVALDDSEGASRALAWAFDHATPDEAFVLVTVLPSARRGQGFPPPHASERQAASDMLEKANADAAAKTGRPAPSAKFEVLEGSPAGEILDAAKRYGADHIVMGARGEGGFPRMLIGSVSSSVVHHADSPVTVVPGASTA